MRPSLTLTETRDSRLTILIARTCYYQLRQLRVVARSLTYDAAATLVHAFVTSRLDHCSSVLVTCP